MPNPLVPYYKHQAKYGQIGLGLSGFAGARYQRGFGFRDFFAKFLPFLRKAGKELLSTGYKIGSDLLEGTSLKESAKTHGKASAKRIAEEALEEMKGALQSGSGMKRP